MVIEMGEGNSGDLCALAVVAWPTRSHPGASHRTPQIPSSIVNIKAQGSRLPVNKARLLPNRIICILGRCFFTLCVA